VTAGSAPQTVTETVKETVAGVVDTLKQANPATRDMTVGKASRPEFAAQPY
jgi:hypothetical protein